MNRTKIALLISGVLLSTSAFAFHCPVDMKKIDAAWGDHAPEVQHQVLFQNAADLYRVPAPDRDWEPARS